MTVGGYGFVALLERVPGFEGDHANFILLAIVFGALGVPISLLRMGHPGRRLQAMKDSPAACATLGLDLTTTKLGIFAFSAAIAGLGGALLAGWKSNLGVTQTDFSLLEGPYAGLPVVLMAVIGGITSVSGAMESRTRCRCCRGARATATRSGWVANPGGELVALATACREGCDKFSGCVGQRPLTWPLRTTLPELSAPAPSCWMVTVTRG